MLGLGGRVRRVVEREVGVLRKAAQRARERLGRAPRVVVGVSGGVDSSVAALLLRESGFEVEGAYVQSWDSKEEEHGACSEDADWESAKQVCGELGIGLRRLDYVDRYWLDVFEPFLESYSSGKTPNPDSGCNRAVKFGALWEDVVDSGWGDFLATGHYARVVEKSGQWWLKRAADEKKDQTLFLCTVPQQRWASVLFPLGGMQKHEVKEVARSVGLPTAARKESMGICFVGKRNLAAFLSNYIHLDAGRVKDLDTGQELGQVEGAAAVYTIGQRVRLGGQATKLFVAKKHTPSNTLFTVPSPTHPALFSSSFCLENHTIPSPLPQMASAPFSARIRHSQHHTIPATVTPHLGHIRIDLETPQRAIAPGQTAALYDASGFVLGGGEVALVDDYC